MEPSENLQEDKYKDEDGPGFFSSVFGEIGKVVGGVVYGVEKVGEAVGDLVVGVAETVVGTVVETVVVPVIVAAAAVGTLQDLRAQNKVKRKNRDELSYGAVSDGKKKI